MDCSAKHRQLGVIYTFARSINLDQWTKKQLTFMENGGNQAFLNFLKKNGASTQPIDYKSAIAQRYKNDLKKKV